MEKIIDCPVCYDADQCFEEVQEKYSSFLCFHCGFMSDSRYQLGSLELVDNLKKSPIPESDQVQYNNYTKRLDVENAMTFGQYEFMGACEEMGIAKDMKRNA